MSPTQRISIRELAKAVDHLHSLAIEAVSCDLPISSFYFELLSRCINDSHDHLEFSEVFLKKKHFLSCSFYCLKIQFQKLTGAPSPHFCQNGDVAVLKNNITLTFQLIFKSKSCFEDKSLYISEGQSKISYILRSPEFKWILDGYFLVTQLKPQSVEYNGHVLETMLVNKIWL